MYKIVFTNDNKTFWSFIAYKPKLVIEYKPNEWVSGKYGPILVFDRFEHAAHFRNKVCRTNCAQIWECEVEDEVKLPPKCISVNEITTGLEPQVIKEFWRDGKASTFLSTYNWPTGTKAFKRIKLTKKVL